MATVRIVSVIWFKTKSFFFAIKRGFSINSVDQHDGVTALHKKIKKEVYHRLKFFSSLNETLEVFKKA